MLRCILCGFDVELDDTVVVSASHRCICLLCFNTETNSHKRMGRTLQRELTATLSTIE